MRIDAPLPRSVSASSMEDEGETIPSAPPMEDLPPGYENAAYGVDADLPPPPYSSLYQTKNLHRQMSTAVDGINADEAKAALIEYADSKCCYGTSAAQNLCITSIENSSAYHYVLETHSEGRKAAWTFEPYDGEPIPAYSLIPAPWDVVISPPERFTEEKRKVPILETRTVKTCHKCNGHGRCRCSHCHGSRKTSCSSCGGSGRKSMGSSSSSDRCLFCHGSGRRTCTWCHGTGKRTCPLCNGKMLLVHFILLQVQWTHWKSHHVIESLDIPEKFIKKVSGDTAFFQENIAVPAVADFWIPGVNEGSAKLVNEHLTEVNKSLHRIIWQRHTVSIIPIAEVQYAWKESHRKFFVFGSEKKVFAPQYPQRCCCCCSIC